MVVLRVLRCSRRLYVLRRSSDYIFGSEDVFIRQIQEISVEIEVHPVIVDADDVSVGKEMFGVEVVIRDFSIRIHEPRETAHPGPF